MKKSTVIVRRPLGTAVGESSLLVELDLLFYPSSPATRLDQGDAPEVDISACNIILHSGEGPDVVIAADALIPFLGEEFLSDLSWDLDEEAAEHEADERYSYDDE